MKPTSTHVAPPRPPRTDTTAAPPPRQTLPPDAKRTSVLARQQSTSITPPADPKAIGSRHAQAVDVMVAVGADGKTTPTRVLLDREATEELNKDFELATYIGKALEKAPRPIAPAVAGALAERVRKRVTSAADPGAAMLFQGLLVDLGHPLVSVAQLKPVLREILHESLNKDVLRTTLAIRSLCNLFPDQALSPDWIAALLECAQSLATARPARALSITLGQLMDTIVYARSEPARPTQMADLLDQAIATAVEPPAYHIGLSGWLQLAVTDGQEAAVMSKVLRALDTAPGLSNDAVANAILTLTSMVMRHAQPSPAEFTARLAPLLKWAMERADGQLVISEAVATGLTRGCQGLLGAQGLLAVVQAVAQAGGAQPTLPARLAAARLINVLTMFETAVIGTPTVAGGFVTAGSATGAAERDAQLAQLIAVAGALLPRPEPADSKCAGTSAAEPLDDVYNLEGPTLVHLGRTLVLAQGGPGIDPAALNAMAHALASSGLGDEGAGLLLFGMAQAAGGAGMSAPRLAALASPLAAAGIPRGTALTCHLVPALRSPAADPPSASPTQRLSQALATLTRGQRAALGVPPGPPGLPEALALGIALGQGPLTALHGSTLSGPDQVRCIAAACCAADGLDAATLSSEVLQCVLLSASDVDLALAAAKWFVAGSGAYPDADALRQLRAALVSQTLRQAAKFHGPNADALLALRLGEIADLYANYCLRVLPAEDSAPSAGKDGKAGKASKGAADPRIAFLRSEAALLSAGPQAGTLAPLVMKLRALGASLAGPPYAWPGG